jgi:hypothetical protein
MRRSYQRSRIRNPNFRRTSRSLWKAGRPPVVTGGRTTAKANEVGDVASDGNRRTGLRGRYCAGLGRSHGGTRPPAGICDQLAKYAALLAGVERPERFRAIAAHITFVRIDPSDLVVSEIFARRKDPLQGWAVKKHFGARPWHAR